MTDKLLRSFPAFGFESKHIHSIKHDQNLKNASEGKKRYMLFNAHKIMGYIPLIGSVEGVIKIIAVKKAKAVLNKTEKRNFTARGTIELLGLGIILLPVDVAFTCKRKIQQLSLNR